MKYNISGLIKVNMISCSNIELLMEHASKSTKLKIKLCLHMKTFW
jgi:hypothetical protein